MDCVATLEQCVTQVEVWLIPPLAGLADLDVASQSFHRAEELGELTLFLDGLREGLVS